MEAPVFDGASALRKSGFSRELFPAPFPYTTASLVPMGFKALSSEVIRMGQGHIMLRKGRSSTAGQIYLVTFITSGRSPHFDRWETASLAASEISSSCAWKRSQLLAWVLMPDHWHGLIQLGDTEVLSGCVRSLKGSTARQLRRAHPQLGRIWAPGFHDRALRKEDDLRAAARYLAMNPVRAGLVERVGDYPYWDAIWI